LQDSEEDESRHDPNGSVEDVDRHLDHRGRVGYPAVTGALHRVVKLIIVEGGEFHLAGEPQQPCFCQPLHLGFQPRLRPGGTGQKTSPQPGRRAHHEQEGDAARTRVALAPAANRESSTR
jgi:hypothetical protein